MNLKPTTESSHFSIYEKQISHWVSSRERVQHAAEQYARLVYFVYETHFVS